MKNHFRGEYTKHYWLEQSISNHNSDDCLLWPFYVDPDGYGVLSYGGQRVLAHRLAFKLTNGVWPKPEGCHSCDQPSCYNPRHVFAGTHHENAADAAKKGRMAAKLTPELVQQIRREHVRYKRGHSALALGRKYGVSHGAILSIVAGKTWAHIPS